MRPVERVFFSISFFLPMILFLPPLHSGLKILIFLFLLGTNSSDDRLRCDISDCVFGATNDTKVVFFSFDFFFGSEEHKKLIWETQFNLTSLSQHVRIDDGDNSNSRL